MNYQIILIVLTALFVSVFCQPDKISCKFTASDGYMYDLTPLMAQGPIAQIDSDNMWTYTVSICQNNINCDKCPKAGYCQTGTLGGTLYTYCIGTIDEGEMTGIPDGKGAILEYDEPLHGGRIGKVVVNCVPGALVANKIAFSPKAVTDYKFTFDSGFGCPTGKASGMSGGTIFLVILIAVAAAYVVGFVAYNYAVKKAQPGPDLLPHLEFWKSVPGLVQDGITYSIQKVKGVTGR